jgi:Mor family transcriptional regulator
MNTEQQLDAFASDEDLQHLLQELENLPPEQRNDVVKRVPAMLQSMIALFEAELKSRSVKNPEDVAQRLVVALAHYFGGLQTYIPRNEKLAKELRNIRIFKAHKGPNIDQLAREFGLTPMQIYSIVSEQLAAEKARRQYKLF